MATEPMPLSFREKSAWAMLVTTTLIYTAYFALAIGRSMAGEVGAVESLGLLLGAAVLQVFALILLHTTFAAASRPEPDDERVTAIERRGERYGSLVLSFGVGLVMLGILALQALDDGPWQPKAPEPTPFAIAHALLAFMVASEIVKYATLVVLYRRGA